MNDLNIQKSANIHSTFDWSNIEYGNTRIGKLRTTSHKEALTIFSIQIFPEYQGHSFGTRTIEYLKQNYTTLIADHVRPTARSFWIKMGFQPLSNDRFVFTRRHA
jgi:GNAT superfamily N-acetyltransferase